SDGRRQVSGVEGVAKDLPAPAPTPASHPGWLTLYTYAENHDDRVRRAIWDDTGAMSLGGGGYGGDGLPPPNYGFNLFGGGSRVQAFHTPVAPVLSRNGVPGRTKYIYQIVARDSKGHETPPSLPAEILGAAALDEHNFIRIGFERSAGAETYLIIRNGQRL